MASQIRWVSDHLHTEKVLPRLLEFGAKWQNSDYLLFYSDADFSSFEYANFLTGTHDDEEEKENKVDTINLIRVRMPKLV